MVSALVSGGQLGGMSASMMKRSGWLLAGGIGCAGRLQPPPSASIKQ